MVDKKSIITQKVKVINVGLDSFYQDLKDLGVDVVHVDWRPPADGDSNLLDILDKLESL